MSRKPVGVVQMVGKLLSVHGPRSLSTAALLAVLAAPVPAAGAAPPAPSFQVRATARTVIRGGRPRVLLTNVVVTGVKPAFGVSLAGIAGPHFGERPFRQAVAFEHIDLLLAGRGAHFEVHVFPSSRRLGRFQQIQALARPRGHPSVILRFGRSGCLRAGHGHHLARHVPCPRNVALLPPSQSEGALVPRPTCGLSGLPACKPPPAPGGLTAVPGDGSVTLTWSASAGAAGYIVYRRPAGGTFALLQHTGQTLDTDAAAQNYVAYAYRVTALGSDGQESEPSATVTATPMPPPAPRQATPDAQATLLSYSTTSSATAAAGYSNQASMSRDGTYVAYVSTARDAGPGADGHAQVYRRNTVTGAIDAVTPDADGDSFYPSISADGASVAFTSNATNLPGSTAPAEARVLVWQAGRGTSLVGVGMAAAARQHTAPAPSISPGGGYVAFQSDQPQLPGEAPHPGLFEIYRYAVAGGQAAGPVLVSRHLGAGPPQGGRLGGSGDAVVADDGSVVFDSTAPDLISPGTDGQSVQVYLASPEAGSVELLSSPQPGVAGAPAASGDARNPMISAGGLVVFKSVAGNLAPGAPGGSWQVYLVDSHSPAPPRLLSVSAASPGRQAGGSSENPRISADGSLVSFYSTATDLTADAVPGGGTYESYGVRLAGGVPASPFLITRTRSQALSGGAYVTSLSADGRSAVFDTAAPVTGPLPPGAGNAVYLVSLTPPLYP